MLVFALTAVVSCTESELEPPTGNHYVVADVDGRHIMVPQKDGNINKINGGQNVRVDARLSSGEGFIIDFRSLLNPGTYYISDNPYYTDPVHFYIYSHGIDYSGSVELGPGTVIVEHVSQNPLNVKLTFSGKIPVRSGSYPYVYDTLDVKNGVADIQF